MPESPASSRPAAEALAVGSTAAHASSLAPKHPAAGTTAPDAAQQQASTSTPVLLAVTAAAVASQPDAAPVGQAVKQLPSIPMALQQEATSAVGDCSEGADEAGKESSRADQPDQTALGGGSAGVEGQRAQQVTKDEVMLEATEAADQLPLSYPATLVATLPCTVPTWLAHSQRTTATAVLPTQLAATQVVQASPARAPAPSAHTVAVTKCSLPSTGTGGVRLSAAPPLPQDRPRLVSRLSQCLASLSEVPPDQAIPGSPSAPLRDADQQDQRKDARRPGQAQAAARAGLPQSALGELSARTAEHSSAAKCQGAQPDEVGAGAGAAGSSPRKQQIAERGKRAAECSPGAYDTSKGTHKRARSDSPTAKQGWVQGDRQGAQQKGPSDADVQVGISQIMIVSTVAEALPDLVKMKCWSKSSI